MFKDILYIAHGWWTPTFELRKERLTESKCLSVVSAAVCLNLEAHDEQTALLWVRGLRQLKQHSDEFSDRSARDNYKNLAETPNSAQLRRKKYTQSVSRLDQLQKDLFVMTLTTVLRHLDEE